MRLPLSDDTLQQLVIGLHKPDNVSHDVTYDRLGLSFSFGGIPVTVEMKQMSRHRHGYDVRLRGFQSFTGPIDPEDDDEIASRGISPTENNDKKYLYYMFKTAVNTAERADQPIEYQSYSPEGGGRTTHTTDSDALPGTGVARPASDLIDAIGIDISGEIFWLYPLSAKTGLDQNYQVQEYVMAKREPESVYSEGFDVVAAPPPFTVDAPRDVLPEIRSDLGFFHNVVTTAVTVDGDGEQFGQASLSTFVNESDELEFEADHDALV
jgi:hypothetical protein